MHASSTYLIYIVFFLLLTPMACKPPLQEGEEVVVRDQDLLREVRLACQKNPPSKRDTVINSYTNLLLLKNSTLGFRLPEVPNKETLRVHERSPEFQRFAFEFKAPHWYLMMQPEEDFEGPLSAKVIVTLAGEENQPEIHLYRYEISVLNKLLSF